jgi:hypothetical protein
MATVRPDSFDVFNDVLAAAGMSDPWAHDFGEEPSYVPAYPLLEALLAIGRASGSLANGVDSWLAHELRRAGFGRDEVWPRATRPRVMPRDIAQLVNSLPSELAAEVRQRLLVLPSVAPRDAKILGRAYEKQVDVVIARWDRGPELMLSTKTMVSSFANNLPNRFEEAYGDAGNLRGRYPLAAVGFFFVQRSTILDKPDLFERTVDMMRKLRDIGGANGYTSTGLLLVRYADEDPEVHVELDPVPHDVRPEQFLTKMIEHVLTTSPVTHHVDVRSKKERRDIPVIEQDSVTQDGSADEAEDPV